MAIPPKKVAIIGAGPSGLVTAKTLLHNFPPGKFAPVVFDSRFEVGGLWNTGAAPTKARDASDPVTLDPRMRTNLSRFTVAFSDLAWESVIEDGDIPMFPQASQVGQYLAAYAQRYIPKDAFRLGSYVRQTKRLVQPDSSMKWRVFWDQKSARLVDHDQPQAASSEKSEDFDYLVVASGYFARPHIPKIPGLAQFDGRVVHSSALAKGHDAANDEDLARGNILVLGGSMSGVESASTFALHRSTSKFHNVNGGKNTPANHSIYHISSRPFWTLPTYLPHTLPSSSVKFLPLDLTMYDLDRRPAGPIEYYLGPIPKEKAVKTNEYFRSLLGAEYEKFGHVHQGGPGASNSSPPWVAIGNDYAGFVQSGTIVPKMGRAVSIHPDRTNKVAAVQIKTADGESIKLENIASIVMATGFTPFESLSFLPEDILSTLEYTTDDSFLPLVLDQGGSLRSEIPDLGFVGYYRGPYWGAMEMQARFLGKTWAQENHELATVESQMQNIRLLRQPATQTWRGQFPMGDYVGLMETFAKDLGIERTTLQGLEGSGPVIPARYIYNDLPSNECQNRGIENLNSEAKSTLDSLSSVGLRGTGDTNTLDSQTGIATAIFRALHGEWKLAKRGYIGEMSGTVTFHPRYPTNPAYDREYVCEKLVSEYADMTCNTKQTIWRLSEAGGTGFPIRIYPMEADGDGLEIQTTNDLKLRSAQHGKNDDIGPNSTVNPTVDHQPDYILQDSTCRYKFWFDRVSISRWEISRIEDDVVSDGSTASTMYTRF
ncbi:hypothetical protein N7509_007147 [Penicillium cosmopolitanum]|uniref:FAD/NAD(P)-binding domain-containing protein n=1 Tax=Penicillium cosmopolitanum TaxID=1131564 RepID=A0A9X0B840_9EURO|nr:uncharacterized protein N7509_007147 [Penicillium cosmopolitanum]KAJ5391657.1 hypothetical protein N7509_007147 [Penicillium cosmopolitanum]